MTFVKFTGTGREGFAGIVGSSVPPRFLNRFPNGLGNALVGKNVLLEGVITLYRVFRKSNWKARAVAHRAGQREAGINHASREIVASVLTSNFRYFRYFLSSCENFGSMADV